MEDNKTAINETHFSVWLVKALLLATVILNINIQHSNATCVETSKVDVSTKQNEWYFNIATAEDLVSFAKYVNEGHKWANARLVADIDMGSVCNETDGTSWTSIAASGAYSELNTWQGTFDGAGHTISGLYVNSKHGAGLFAYSGGLIKDLTIEGKIVGQRAVLGGFAVWPKGRIDNCYSDMTVVAPNQHATQRGLGSAFLFELPVVY